MITQDEKQFCHTQTNADPSVLQWHSWCYIILQKSRSHGKQLHERVQIYFSVFPFWLAEVGVYGKSETLAHLISYQRLRL